VERLAILSRLFARPDLVLHPDRLQVGERSYPIVDGVFVLLDPEQYPAALRQRLGRGAQPAGPPVAHAADIQATFGQEWAAYPSILAEHEADFRCYFDLIDLAGLRDALVMDLGCGIGRWSHFIAPHCAAVVLVDFSEAIFIAARNLAGCTHALFIMGDVTRLPFASDCCDFAFSLGVLHHLPIDALQAVRLVGRLAPRLLVYLYYALDNRPWHFRALLMIATGLRRCVCRITAPLLRALLTWLFTVAFYLPVLALGTLLRPFGLARLLPLQDNRGRSFYRLRQEVYDRFFTRIEQRVTRIQILALQDRFSTVTVAETFPYWHFLCRR
jgi:SAM-dependent methyltransferase